MLGTRCQAAHLICHHGEATALLASARSLDGGVERQQVGLLSDTANHIKDAADALAVHFELTDHLGRAVDLGRQCIHHFDGPLHLLATRSRFMIGMPRFFGGASGAARHLLHGGRHLVHGGRHLVGFRALTLDASIGLLGHRRRLLSGGSELGSGTAQLADHSMEALAHAVEGCGDAPQFISGLIIRRHSEVTGRHLAGGALQRADSAADTRDR